MKSYFKDIFEYQNEVNQYMLQELINLENIPDHVHLLISHSLNAQQVWNARINNTQEIGVFDIHSLKDCKKIDNENLKISNLIIEKIDLETIIYYSSTSGTKYQNNIIEIFNQIIQHFSYHRGQIISKMIDENIVFKPTDYIYWRRKELIHNS